MGYHNREIQKGVFGEFSKIYEEYEELLDALQQRCKILVLVEISDLLGAINGYLEKFNLSINNNFKYDENYTPLAIESNERSCWFQDYNIFRKADYDRDIELLSKHERLIIFNFIMSMKDLLNQYNMNLQDANQMSMLTARAFKDGSRK